MIPPRVLNLKYEKSILIFENFFENILKIYFSEIDRCSKNFHLSLYGGLAPKGPYRHSNIGTDGATRKESLKSLYMYTVSHIGKKHNIQILSTGKRRIFSAYSGYLFNSRIIIQVPLWISGSQYRRTSASFSKLAINRPEAVQAVYLYPFRPWRIFIIVFLDFCTKSPLIFNYL